jgi:hypothetical protein
MVDGARFSSTSHGTLRVFFVIFVVECCLPQRTRKEKPKRSLSKARQRSRYCDGSASKQRTIAVTRNHPLRTKLLPRCSDPSATTIISSRIFAISNVANALGYPSRSRRKYSMELVRAASTMPS